MILSKIFYAEMSHNSKWVYSQDAHRETLTFTVSLFHSHYNNVCKWVSELTFNPLKKKKSKCLFSFIFKKNKLRTENICYFCS